MYPQYRDWEIVRLIGEGSFGSVYEIKREVLGHVSRAALKVITIPSSGSEIDTARSNGMDDASIVEYYQSVAKDIIKEVQVMDQLKGITNIVSYEDFEYRPHEDGYGWDIFIQMELLTSLTHYLNSPDSIITRRDVIRLGIDICKALEECQKESIIHRDIKPGNILISDRGHYKLGDFGIARTVEGTSSIMAMSKKGTYSYMAPEVYKAQGYGYNVDIYSLGLVMYWLLNNNRHPFMPPYPDRIRVGDAERALAHRMSGEPIPQPCSDRTRLAEIVLKACSYNPKERYSSPREMRGELEAILTNAENPGPVLWPIGNTDSSFVPSPVPDPEPTPETDAKDERDADLADQKTAGIWASPEEEEEREVKVTEESDSGEPDSAENSEKTTDIFHSGNQSADRDLEGTTDIFHSGKQEAARDSERTTGLFDDHKSEDGNTISLFPPVPGSEQKSETDNDDRKDAEQDTEKNEPVSGFGAVQPEQQPNKPEKPEKKRTVLPIILAVCLALGLAVGLMIHRNMTTVVIPDVTGMTTAEARAELQESGLTVSEETTENSDDIEKGQVIRAENQGTRVEKGSEVVLVTSLGETISIEDYVGQAWEETQKKLTEAGLTVKQKTANSNEFENGIVMAQSVEAGNKLNEGSSIILTVSVGPKMVTVGDYQGMKEDEAKQQAEKAGFTVQTTKEYSTKVKKGRVISQSLKKKTEAVEGETITLVISQGVEQVKVPNLVGKSESEAEKALKEAGLKTGEVTRSYSSSVDSGTIISQRTDAGTSVDKGSSVSYEVSKGEEPKSSSGGSSKKKSSSKKKKKKKKKKSGGADLHW